MAAEARDEAADRLAQDRGPGEGAATPGRGCESWCETHGGPGRWSPCGWPSAGCRCSWTLARPRGTWEKGLIGAGLVRSTSSSRSVPDGVAGEAGAGPACCPPFPVPGRAPCPRAGSHEAGGSQVRRTMPLCGPWGPRAATHHWLCRSHLPRWPWGAGGQARGRPAPLTQKPFTGVKATSVGTGGTPLPPRPVTTHCQAVLAGVGTRTGHEGRSGHSVQLPGHHEACPWPGPGGLIMGQLPGTGSGRRWGRLPPAGPHGHGGGWASEQLTWNSTRVGRNPATLGGRHSAPPLSGGDVTTRGLPEAPAGGGVRGLPGGKAGSRGVYGALEPGGSLAGGRGRVAGRAAGSP